MKRLLSLLFLLPLFASAAQVQRIVEFEGTDGIDAITKPQIQVRADADATSVYADWEQDGTRVRVFLEKQGGDWFGRFPANHAGIAYYTLVAESDDDRPQSYVTQSYNITNNLAAADGLTNHRYPNIYGWSIGSSGTGNLDANWYGMLVSRSSSVRQMITLAGSPVTNVPAFSGSNAGGFIRHRTKLDGGVGSIWFKARMAETNTIDGTIAIDRITSTGSGLSMKYDITEIAEVEIPASVRYNEWQQFHLVLQDYPEGYPASNADKAYFRIRNKTLAASSSDADRAGVRIDLCDLVLAPPIPDVKIVKDDMDYNPGFPSVQDPITFHLTVTNLYECAPAEYITPRLVWRQGDTDKWKTNVMENVEGRTNQGSGVYACTLTPDDPVQPFSDGPFEYFYQVGFTGYTPVFPAIKDYDGAGLNNMQNFRFDWGEIDGFYQYLIHTNVWALLTDANGNVSESRSPAYYPDFYDRYNDESVPGGDDYVNYAFDRAAVDGSAADERVGGSWWGFTRKFDLFDLDEGWPSAKEPHYATRSGSGEISYDNREIQIPAKFPYCTLKANDGIRRFRSFYTDIAAVTADWTNEAPSHLERAYAMQHVGDYTWQAIIHITNAVDSLFSVTGALYAADGATNFVAGPFEWLEIDQEDTNINPPMSGEWSEQHDSSLHRFASVPVDKERTVHRTEIIPVPVATTNTGWYVGVVTNLAFYSPDYTNELGARILPTIDDVGYWAFELEEETTEDRITGEITVSTNPTPVLSNWYQDRFGVWRELTYGSREINQFITRGDSIRFTNENQKVVTAVDWVDTTNEWDEVEYYVEWVPDPEELPESCTNLRTRVQIDYDGFLMFRFCTTNGSYQIRRAAWQDFNTWQADDKKYWRSAGLYDMKTFTSDAEGKDLTVFQTSFSTLFLDQYAVDSENARKAAARLAGEPVGIGEWTEASDGEYWNGLIGKNAQLMAERTASDPKDRKSKQRNGAILLNTYPKNEGTVQSSNLQTGNGRDTLSLRVRAYSDDERCVTYAAAPSDAANYRVVARLRYPGSDQVSDAEHSLSLVGYWQDPFNYWEARIVQKSQIVDGTGSSGNVRTKYWFEIHVYKWVEGEATEVFGQVWQNDMAGDNWNNTKTSRTRLAQWPMWQNNGNTNGNDRAYIDNNAEYGQLCNSGKEGGWAFAFDLSTDANGGVTPVVYGFLQGRLVSRANEINLSTNAMRHAFRYACDKTGGGTTSGRPGYNLRDCGLQIAPYVYDLTADNAEMARMKTWLASSATAWSAVPTSPDSSWDHNSGAVYDRKQKIDVWKVTKGGTADSNPTAITRKEPKVYYGVEVYRTGQEVATNLFTAPIGQVSGNTAAKWDDEWDAYHGHAKDGPQLTKSWGWETVEIPMAFWDDAFINIRAYSENPDTGDPSLALLAVDSLSCDDWRGQTVFDKDKTEGDDDEEVRWIAKYAAVVADGREGRKYQLNRSQANPKQNRTASRQGICSPLLENGVGDVSFTYTVDDHPVQITVGVLDSTGQFVPYATETLMPTNVSTPYYVYIATNLTGRIYVTTDEPDPDAREEGRLGTIFLDNLRATDYPATGSTSWEAYNMLVSTFPADVSQRAGYGERELRKLKFDGISEAARSLRSAVFNDGPDHQTINSSSLSEHPSNLQTPSIETGIGEVSFWYRASPDNNGQPARISLMMSESASKPDHLWTPLTTENLYSNLVENPRYWDQVRAMEELECVTNTAWKYFNVEFYEQDYRVLRVVAGDGVNVLANDHNRVLIDNVLVTEPVRSSIDIGAIEFDPGVPLSTKDTGVKVTLVNPRMNPHDIEVTLDWFVDPKAPADFEIPTVTYNVWTQNVEETIYYDVTTGQVVDRSHRNDPGVVAATWYRDVEHVETNETVEVTRVPTTLEGKWGWEKWGGRPTGTLTFTNAPGSSRVFLSVEKIPTQLRDGRGFPPDTVIQYCVKVHYQGRFAEDVLSETQGRVKNGYWFSNPPWYEPIDLNVAFGTAERPVSHAFVFSCSTNVAFINEFRAWMGPTASASTYLKKQFVELAGPAGASLGNWKLEHWGIVSRTIDTSWVYFTNSISPDAKFVGPKTNNLDKGWGFYILGGSGIERANEPLFPGSDEESTSAHTDGNRYLDPAQGALRLRRSMGAYVDKICWGTHNQVGELERAGFTWMDYIRNYSRENRANYVYAIIENNGSLAWGSSSSSTEGEYNLDQEELLPFVDGTKIEEPDPPLVGPPVITDYAFSADGTELTLTFKVCVTNGIALTGDAKEGVSWDVESKSTLDRDADWSDHSEDGTLLSISSPVTAPETGEWAEGYTATVRVNPLDGARFFRVKAKVAK